MKLDLFEQRILEKEIQIDAIAVVQNGEMKAHKQYSKERYHNVYSIAKSYLATAVGMAIDEGILSLEDKPVDFFPEYLPENLDEGWKSMTVRHLLTMTSGHGRAYLMAIERKALRDPSDIKYDQSMKEEWLRFVFACPLAYEPGEKFVYGNQSPYLLGRMLEKVSGMTVLDYLYERLWKPLNMPKPRWDADGNGHTFPASDLFLDTLDMITLGQIYLGKGEYQGIRFLTEEWVSEVTTCHVGSSSINPAGESSDEKNGYGYYFWMNSKEGYRAYGKLGQFILVFPDKNAVVAIQANHKNVQELMNIMWETIYMQL